MRIGQEHKPDREPSPESDRRTQSARETKRTSDTDAPLRFASVHSLALALSPDRKRRRGKGIAVCGEKERSQFIQRWPDGPNRDTDIYLYAKRIAHRETQLSLTCLFLFDSWPLTATTPEQDELRTTDSHGRGRDTEGGREGGGAKKNKRGRLTIGAFTKVIDGTAFALLGSHSLFSFCFSWLSRPAIDIDTTSTASIG